jgi:VWFA-related protein
MSSKTTALLFRPALALIVLLQLSITSLIAKQERSEQPPRPQQQGTAIRIGSEEVLLDIVVRDKKGRPIADLKETDLEVYEDSVRQRITSFRSVKGGPFAGAGRDENVASTPAETGAKSDTPDPARQINLVTMVFERLNNESRILARQAATEFLKNELASNVFVTVYAVDLRLRVIQHFTSNRERVKTAIELATGQASGQFTERSEEIRRELEKAIPVGRGPAGLTGNIERGGSSADLAQAATEQKFAEMTLNTLRAEENAEQQVQGTASVYSLMSLVAGQQQLLGRKTVLYFSEGMQIPPNLVDPFRGAISAANRANMSFYTIDARGLGSGTQMEAQRDTLLSAARSSQTQQTSRGGQAITFDQAGIFDTAESSMRKNRQATLAELAESTGGFLVANTNDMRRPMQRVATELSSYYIVSYVPTVREYDGKFRSITVKALRPDIVLQTRSGYFALPPMEGSPVMPFELPLLAALNLKPLPRDFEYRALMMHFAARPDAVQHLLVLEVPLANLSFKTGAEQKTYSLHGSLMALIKNSEGRVVQKLSQDFPVEGPAAKLEALKKGNLLFTRSFWLPFGRYTLETIAYDRETKKSSARRSVLIVAPSKSTVRMSSITVIKRVDPVDPNLPNLKETENPMRFAEGKIIPNLDDAIRPVPGAQLSFYFIVYPAADATEKPGLTLDFLLDGEVIARATPELTQPDEQGRIPYIATVPMEKFKAGRYELRAVVNQGQQSVEEHAFFTIEQ